MAKADTLTFSRRVKDLIWMEINFISQILGYSKHGPFFVPYSEFPWFCWRISCAVQQLCFPTYSARLQKYMCVCVAHHRTWYHGERNSLFWQPAEGDWHSSWTYLTFFPPPKAVAVLHWKDEKAVSKPVMPQPCCPACEFLWGAPKGWQCWHTRSSHCAINSHDCNSLSVTKMAQKF